jgi:hypothetical protein
MQGRKISVFWSVFKRDDIIPQSNPNRQVMKCGAVKGGCQTPLIVMVARQREQLIE